ncbi:MAG TPA: DUF1015 family protein [Pirellulaceae bacterium]|mgnify:CR=1 FL=1|nr:DUF1015 family protein [Pirellulaceae bacterium]HMO91085.1 DUF1015 family protein [Pirellulaceae bacterium]HMP71184.1 DUF1015 family protein [Pirellulaceae bacterium]
MIKIYPFRAYMPSGETADEIASQPYDVISVEEARRAAEGKPHSFLHVIRSEIDLPEDIDPYDERVYAMAAMNLDSMITRGLLVASAEPSIFVYRLTFQGLSQSGVVACVDAAQYRSGAIKKHEKTRPDKEDDRTRHMTTCSAHAEPVFLTFRDSKQIQQLLDDDTHGRVPLIDFVAEDQVRHQIWSVGSSAAYVNAFASVDALYIADGHHRTAGGERAALARENVNPNHTGNEEYNRIMAVVFPASHLRILAYNRVVYDFNQHTEHDFLKRLEQVGTLEKTDDSVPRQAGEVCVRVGSGWYRLQFPPDSIDYADPIGSLDVSLLQSRVLAPILGIGDPRTDARIGFVGGIRGTGELDQYITSGRACVAFSMYPTSMDQLLNVSDAGEIMPPKSTWFEPKLRSGLFVHRFERY